MQLREEDHRANRKLCQALSHAMTMTAQTVPLQWLQTLALLSSNENLTITEIARVVGTSQSTMSRQLLDMGRSKRDGTAGHGLVYSVPHPWVPLGKSYRLTLKGQTLVADMASLLTTGSLPVAFSHTQPATISDRF